jgi:uncharacterized protein (TIGR03118 family)
MGRRAHRHHRLGAIETTDGLAIYAIERSVLELPRGCVRWPARCSPRDADYSRRSIMHVFLRSASLLFAASVVIGCSTTNHLPDAAVQPTGFIVQNLLSDQVGVAPNVNAALVNPWGITSDGQSFWIANNGSGRVLVIAADGTPSKFAPADSTLDVGAPMTGIVRNTSSGFTVGTSANNAPATMLVATEDGKIFGINPTIASTPQLLADRSAAGAVYKGLTLFTTSANATFLAATDFHNARIDLFDTNANLAATVIVVDPNLRAGLAPFNIMALGSNLYVTYAVQDAAAHDDVPGVGNGRLDVFDLDGHFLRTIIDGGLLNAPWGMAFAPADFSSALAGQLMVGNFGDGTVLSVDVTNGNSVQLANPSGNAVVIDGLWGLIFGDGNIGAKNSLYFNAGPNNETHGLYGRILLGTTPTS